MARIPDTKVIAFGTLAEYDSAAALRAAWQAGREAGYAAMEYYAPIPLEDLHGEPGMRLSAIAGAWALLGTVLGFAMQAWSAVFDYELLVGGRPLFSWPAFMLVTFELTVLFGAFGAFFGMLGLNGLPRLHHPLFNARRFELQSSNRFYLLIRAEDEQYDRRRVHELLDDTDPLSIEEVAR